MGMNPTEYHQIFGVAVIEEVRLVDSIASVRRALLIWDDEFRDKKCVRDECSAENPACLKVGAGIR